MSAVGTSGFGRCMGEDTLRSQRSGKYLDSKDFVFARASVQRALQMS